MNETGGDFRPHPMRRSDDYFGPPSRHEHDELAKRVSATETMLDRIQWLVIATLATAIVDLVSRISGGH